MSTPLEPFSNARLLFAAPGGRGGPETGFMELAGEEFVIGAFLKQVTQNKRALFKDMVDLRMSTEIFQGYITGFCPLPVGEDWKTYDFRSDANYDSTGHRPTGLRTTSSVDLHMSEQTFTHTEVLDASGEFFDEGIGAMVRAVIGDRLIVKFERF